MVRQAGLNAKYNIYALTIYDLGLTFFHVLNVSFGRLQAVIKHFTMAIGIVNFSGIRYNSQTGQLQKSKYLKRLNEKCVLRYRKESRFD